MSLTEKQFNEFKELICDSVIDEEWFLRHTEITFDDRTKTITIKIDNINEQDYNYMRSDFVDAEVIKVDELLTGEIGKLNGSKIFNGEPDNA